MTESQRRLLAGTCFLAALWVLVYWLWQPSRGTIRFDRASAEPPAGERPLARESAPPPAAREGVAEPVGVGPGPIRDPLGEVAIPPEAVPAPLAPARFREYTIRPDDTFERIAERELGSRARAAEIVAANPGKDPRRLQIGDVIRIPTEGAVASVPAPPGAAAPAAPAQPPSSAVPATYTVRGGDSLSVISQRLYGTSRHAGLIFEANRDQLASADDIREGQVLRIPARPE